MAAGPNGKVALVTGASAGIGRAIAKELGREGVRLVVTGRRRAELEKVADEIAALGAPRAGIVAHDALADDYVDAVVNQCEGTLGGVDILMNNAGGSRAFGKDATDEQWAEALTLNFTRHRQLTNRLLPGMQARKWGRVVNITGKQEPDGVNGAFCAKAAIPLMRRARGGAIVNVASVRSVVAGGGNLQYDTTKAAVAGLTRALAADHSPEGIRVNAVGPGPIFTPFHQRRIAASGETVEQYNARAAQGTMLKRPGRAEEVAAAILFLASDDASYVTGALLFVDGGMTAM